MNTLQAILAMGLTDAQVEDSEEIMKAMRNRWLCEFRDPARKCKLETDCCAKCEPSRIPGVIIFGVQNNVVQVDLLRKGMAVTLDEAGVRSLDRRKDF